MLAHLIYTARRCTLLRTHLFIGYYPSMYYYPYITPFPSRLLPAGREGNPKWFLCSRVPRSVRSGACWDSGEGKRFRGRPCARTQTPPRRMSTPSVSSSWPSWSVTCENKRTMQPLWTQEKKKANCGTVRLLGRPGLASTIASSAHLHHARSLSIVGAYQRPATRTPLAAKAATHESTAPPLTVV